MRRTRMKKLALLLSLLALGLLGLVACGGGGDEDRATAAKVSSPSTTEATRSETTTGSEIETPVASSEELAADKKPCGRFGRYRFAVVEGDVSCRVARGVMRANSLDPPPPGGKDRGVPGQPRRFPGSWSCGDGPDTPWVCVDEAEEMIVAWCCGMDQHKAMKYFDLSAYLGASTVKVNSKVIIADHEPAFHGRVKSSRDDCLKHRKVKVFRKRNGQDKLIGKDKTSRNGRWLIHLVKRPGTYPGAYQANVRRKKDDRNGTTLICEADTSVTRYWH
jgi:hypothetical protein